MKNCIALALVISLSSHSLAEPSWIWSAHQSKEREKAAFRKAFEIPGAVKSATLQLSCDNGAIASLNGKGAAECPDWQSPAKVDAARFLKPGANEITIQAENRGGAAALVVKLDIELADGKKLAVETGEGWETSSPKMEKWKPAAVIAKYGSGPWGDVFSGKGGRSQPAAALEPAEIVLLPGFKAELLYTVPKLEQGSWVSMTVDPKGRILACDQYGALYRVTVPPVGSGDKTQVEQLPNEIGGAHGLLHAFDNLYFMLNESSATPNKGRKDRSPGLYRLKDNGDGTFGEPQLLRETKGGGEHGPHSIQLSPDGKSIFFNCGNHTKLPENLDRSRPAMNSWDEDHVLPRMWDANGHARGIMAPGGYICQTDPDGKVIDLFCLGFRNEFDFAFNSAGEMFTFDADMEWDMGSPWYRPTRINHCVSGADYGWRSGSGKWPVYYPDNLPATVDIGPGSPTGVVAGTGARFPAKYQRAVYAADWTYGTLYAIHSTPKGGTYESVKEEFVSGKPLPLTDLLIHPDGAMYFAIGGRRTQSALYRVIYTGSEPTTAAEPLPLTPEFKLRHELEKLHLAGAGPEAIDQALPRLGHPDRFVRYAARVAIEKQPVAQWKDKVLALSQPDALIEGMVALARMGRSGATPPPPAEKPKAGSSSAGIGLASGADAELQKQILDALSKLEGQELSVAQVLGGLRAVQLTLTRLGKPDAEVCSAIAERLEAVYPHTDSLVNRELCQILIAIDSPKVVSKTLGLMATAKDDHEAIAAESLLARNEGYANAAKLVSASRPNQQQIACMFALRNAKAGWTPDLRKTFFSWFPHARTWKGGNSFKGFIENIRKEALANFAPPDELAELDALSSRMEAVAMPNITPPKGPGRAWTMDEVLALATKEKLKDRNLTSGKNLFAATMCLTCHRFAGDGGGIGPDITGAASRYTMRDLMENIIDPSKVISDQYGTEVIEKKDGASLIGRPIVEENDKLFVMTNPFAPNDHVAIDTKTIKSRKPAPISMMPPGLINSLNPDELLDLIAYIMAGGP